jgi:ABC-type Mn2+/Zn2+ transport systems, permease components
MNHILELIALAPVQRGFFAFLVAGMTFPIVGVFIVVLDLVTLRFTLMHGALLGGVLGILFGVDGLLVSLGITVIIASLLGPASSRLKIDISNSSALFMIATVALAFLIIDKAHIAALDAFSVFWGSIYALSPGDVVIVCLTAAMIVGFLLFNRRRITAVLFDRDIAFSVGVRSAAFINAIIVITGVVIAVLMKLIGALLVDCLLILPALGAVSLAKSMKQLFGLSVLLGFVSSLIGFIVSLVVQIQPSQAVTFVSLALLALMHGGQAIRNRRSVRT